MQYSYLNLVSIENKKNAYISMYEVSVIFLHLILERQYSSHNILLL